MSHTVRKLFIDFEKEEQWLNDMAAKGLALTEYSWARYVFEESGKGEYIYRIELLEDGIKGAKSVEYLQFMEEAGVERVIMNKGPAAHNKWVIFRRKASEGPFTIYSDTDSKIKHYRRIHRLWMSVALMEFIIGFMNVGLVALDYIGIVSNINLVMGLLLIILGAAFLLFSVPVHQKIKKLQSDKLIRE
ncbi:hypothetical protein PAECIP111892_02595 [Paenibacillus auburnensis]|uniref:DUF2812 domain-containing protein n=1 Tax=Paenibacillus auburnensis TaxID=2905649 RepID=A0ABN8GBT8_9BACL|nr:DUF2812 domain-containing protein [Paenibacillus auburnensis]CAH1204949.1 hypothetical protein PAECIP111892_02595 [Paenibacillus auburnensis]